jgi:hypothetical protein
MKEIIFSTKHFKAYQSLNIREMPTTSDLRNGMPSIKTHTFANFTLKKETGKLSQYSNRLWAGQRWFNSRQEQDIFIFSAVSKPALRPTQPPTQGVLRPLPPWVKSPIHLHTMLINELSTGTSPFIFLIPFSLPLRNDKLMVAWCSLTTFTKLQMEVSIPFILLISMLI